MASQIQNSLSVSNSIAKDCHIAGVFEEVNTELIRLIKTAELNPKPLMICSGGTSSRCAANGHWTLDLRKRYQKISFNPIDKTVIVGAGISMGNLLKKLNRYNRSFPAGLSSQTGLGYILTGGISPLSRSKGLAIDQILQFQGFWGNGTPFTISKPTKDSTKENKLIWRGLTGAAPFLGIITSLKLKTYQSNRLKVYQMIVNKKELIRIISEAEIWPKNISLQWHWGEKINIYIVVENTKGESYAIPKKIIKGLSNPSSLRISEIYSQENIPTFPSPLIDKNNLSKLHSEVVGLLGPSMGTDTASLINSLEQLIINRPNKSCYVAAQQLGEVTSNKNRESTSFIHRQAIWKPWITATWPAGDEQQRYRSLAWLEEVWLSLRPFYPGIHLAQMHQHLSWHNTEIKSAFEEWLPGLQKLKSEFDPQGILPRL